MVHKILYIIFWIIPVICSRVFLCVKLWSTAYRQDWLIYDGLFDVKNVIFMKKAIF